MARTPPGGQVVNQPREHGRDGPAPTGTPRWRRSGRTARPASRSRSSASTKATSGRRSRAATSISAEVSSPTIAASRIALGEQLGRVARPAADIDDAPGPVERHARQKIARRPRALVLELEILGGRPGHRGAMVSGPGGAARASRPAIIHRKEAPLPRSAAMLAARPMRTASAAKRRGHRALRHLRQPERETARSTPPRAAPRRGRRAIRHSHDHAVDGATARSPSPPVAATARSSRIRSARIEKYGRPELRMPSSKDTGE